MRQVARRLRDGSLELVEVPDPPVGPGGVAVRVECSIVSSGTERATLEVAKSSMLTKARARPDQVRAVVDRARKEGLRSTIALVRQRLEELGPLGYSAAGVAVDVGERARGVSPGDRVAIAGGGFANHAELDVVPSLLCARVPDGVSGEDAAFATLGAIALHGFRRAEVGVGSTVAVIGLGLIGQLAVRLARAAGCRVLGVDLEPSLCELARGAGAEAVERSELEDVSRHDGRADAVLICASSTSSDPVALASRLARDRATVVVVGAVGMDVPRAPFYDRELDLRLSRSYGPGRYDPEYELHGIDYPIGHVRWTEQRNMTAFLQLVADGALRPSELVTHRFEIADAERAFATLTEESPVAIALRYPDGDGRARAADTTASAQRRPRTPRARGAKPRFAVIGAGGFATGTLIPGLVEAGLEPAVVASARGLTAADARDRFGFAEAVGDPTTILERGDIDLVAIATQHDTHSSLAAAALAAGLCVYVEKPLALDHEGLAEVRAAQERSGAPLMVGFNRRHAPAAEALREAAGGPRLMSYRVNAGRLPVEHWTNDLDRGGGRLLGEGCHFVDFLCDQAGTDPVSVLAGGYPSDSRLPLAATDNFGIQLRFADASVGSIQYAADAPTGPGKERFEVSGDGLYGVIDDFREAMIWRGSKRERLGGRRQDKGFRAQYGLLAGVVRGEREPPPAESYFVSALATLAASRSLQDGAAAAIVVGDAGNGSSGGQDSDPDARS